MQERMIAPGNLRTSVRAFIRMWARPDRLDRMTGVIEPLSLLTIVSVEPGFSVPMLLVLTGDGRMGWLSRKFLRSLPTGEGESRG